MNWLCLVEAMNLDNLFSDCEDLSTVRGGGLSVLNLGARVAEQLGISRDAAIVGASQGLFRVSSVNAEAARNMLVRAIEADEILRHTTVFVAAQEEGSPDRFQATLADLRSNLRWQQMQPPSVVYPELKGSRNVCVIDRVRPAAARHDLDNKSVQSDFTYERRILGRERRRHLLHEILDRDDFEIAEHLGELASGGEKYGNAKDKIAVLRFDGNSFGKKYEEQASFNALRDFSRGIKAQQRGFFRALLESDDGPIPPEWWADAGRLRLEIVVYGGDEVTFIVPAWLGWAALKKFYNEASRWPDVSYAGAVVFCHHKTPIHSAKRLASQLVDQAKELGGRTNAAVYQVLESFDAIGRDLKEFMAERYRFANGQGVCLDGGAVAAMDEAMPALREGVSRRKLHEAVMKMLAGEPLEFEAVAEGLTEDKNSAPEVTRRKLKELYERLGSAALLHVLELWDYAGVQHER